MENLDALVKIATKNYPISEEAINVFKNTMISYTNQSNTMLDYTTQDPTIVPVFLVKLLHKLESSGIKIISVPVPTQDVYTHLHKLDMGSFHGRFAEEAVMSAIIDDLVESFKNNEQMEIYTIIPYVDRGTKTYATYIRGIKLSYGK